MLFSIRKKKGRIETVSRQITKVWKSLSVCRGKVSTYFLDFYGYLFVEACFFLFAQDGGKIEECVFTRDALLSNYPAIFKRAVWKSLGMEESEGKEKANLRDTMPRLISIEGSLWKTVRRMPGSAREHPLSFCTTKISLGYYHGARLGENVYTATVCNRPQFLEQSH